MYWQNYRTGATDERTEPPTDYSDYIPRNNAALNLYQLYQDIGDTPQEAYIKVMELIIGKGKQP